MDDFKNVNELLDFAIESEQKAADFYKMLSENSTNEQMAEVFKGFMQEEMGHKARLIKIKETGSAEAVNEKIADLKIADYMVTVQVRDDMTYQEALILAMTREKMAFKLYLDLADKTSDPELKKIFMMLAQDEAKHKLRFELEYDDVVLKEN